MDQPQESPLSGDELRRRRIALGWSRNQLGHAVGVAADEVSQWESGDAPVRYGLAVRYALEHAEDEVTAVVRHR